MRITHEKTQQLSQLRVLLKGACHAPKCDRIRICPRQCKCRVVRSFELNTDTAICWEIAELLWILQRSYTVNKAYVKEIKDKIIAYAEVSRHHSTKGWERFFWRVERTYSTIMDIQDSWPDPGPEDLIYDLKKRLIRLKRYPKE